MHRIVGYHKQWRIHHILLSKLVRWSYLSRLDARWTLDSETPCCLPTSVSCLQRQHFSAFRDRNLNKGDAENVQCAWTSGLGLKTNDLLRSIMVIMLTHVGSSLVIGGKKTLLFPKMDLEVKDRERSVHWHSQRNGDGVLRHTWSRSEQWSFQLQRRLLRLLQLFLLLLGVTGLAQ